MCIWFCVTMTCHSFVPSTSYTLEILRVQVVSCTCTQRFPELQQPLNAHLLTFTNKTIEEYAAS